MYRSCRLWIVAFILVVAASVLTTAERIVFLRIGATQAELFISHADGSGFHVVTTGPNNNAFPSCSPDGKRIVYRTAGPAGDGLRIINPEDKSIDVLTNEYDNFPVWSPRGDLIARS